MLLDEPPCWIAIRFLHSLSAAQDCEDCWFSSRAVERSSRVGKLIRPELMDKCLGQERLMEKTKVEKEEVGFSPRIAFVSLFMILVTTTVISLFIYKANREFISNDPLPEVFPIVPATTEEMGSPAPVKVGLYIKDFTEFSFLTNQFEFSGIVWFLFDPSIVSLDTLSKFSFEKAQLKFKSPPTTRIVGGHLFARFDVRVSFKANLTFVRFPFDNHTLYIILDNNAVTPGEVAFMSSYNELAISPEISISGWALHGTRVYTGYSVARLDKQNPASDVAHPRAIFAIEYVHSGIRQSMLIILPLLLIFFMALFAFAFKSTYYTSVISISSGAVTALLAYRFVIEGLSPKVGYFTQSDYIFFLFLLGVFVAFFINVGLASFSKKYAIPLIILLHCMVILSFILALRW